MKDIKIAVVGLGYVGLPLARLFSTKFPTIGYDLSQARVDALMAGHDATLEVPDALLRDAIDNHGFVCTTDLEAIRGCNFYVVAVPTPVDRNNNPDLAPLYGASTTVGKVISKGDIVVYESTVYPGVTEDECIPVVEKVSGLKGRLVRPLSARLLEPTVPELEGRLDREQLLDLSGRGRERQIALAAEFGIVDYPSPAGGCKLTEEGFCRKLRDLMDHEGLGDRRLVHLLTVGRRFRLAGGTGVALGRDRIENQVLKELDRIKSEGSVILSPVNVPGPTAFIPSLKGEADFALATELVAAYSRYDRLEGEIVLSVRRAGAPDERVTMPRPYSREKFKACQIC